MADRAFLERLSRELTDQLRRCRGGSRMTERRITITLEAWFDPADAEDEAFLRTARDACLGGTDQVVVLTHAGLRAAATMRVSEVAEEMV